MSENQGLETFEEAMETDDDRLAYTQGLRKKLIKDMTVDGTQMPSDKGDRMVLLAALGDMDRTSLSNKKIGSQERQGAQDRQAALIIARLSNHGFDTPSGSPFERPIIEGQVVRRAEVELDTEALPQLTLAPGETDVGLSTKNYDEFMRDSEPKE